MRRMTSSEVRQVQLELLNAIADFCEEQKLRYVLAAGTLIGAVRHHGYIPWDDDIDLDMPREDYMRFLETFPTNGHRRVLSIYDNTDYYLPYAKVVDTRTLLQEDIAIGKSIGVNIDIFPIDNLSSDNEENARLCRTNIRWSNILNIKIIRINRSRSVWKNLVLLFGKILLAPLSYRWILKQMDKTARRFEYCKDSPFIGSVSYGNPLKKCLMERVQFNEDTELEFEGRKYRVPKEYDAILTRYYGDYMTPPPENQQVSTHVYQAFWLD